MKTKNKFKAVYNPYLRILVVKYGDSIIEHSFKDTEEWCCISYNADEKHPNYLHVQLEYDETFQLLFYPRVQGSEDLNEELGTYYNSGEKVKPKRIKIVHTDEQFNKEIKKLGDYRIWENTEYFKTKAE